MRYIIAAFLLLSVSTFLIIKKYNQDTVIFTIGGGSEKAAYYPVARALCKIYNEHKTSNKFTCQAKITRGGQYNLNSIENGLIDMGISQASLQSDAYFGRRLFRGLPHKKLRTLLRLHNEYFTVIAKKGSNIKKFSDIYGKSINIGNQGSGSRFLFLKMIKILNWNLSSFEEIYNESASDIDKVLCGKNAIANAAVHKIGHPNQSFANMLKNCDTYLVNLSENEIKKFTSNSNKFWSSEIPQKYYPELKSNIKTFSSKAILTVSKDLDYNIIEDFVNVLIAHKEELVKEKPSLSNLEYLTNENLDLAPVF